MPIYSVQGPDGRIYDVEGPAGASEEQIINVVRRQYLMQAAAPKEDTTGFKAAAAAGLERLKGEAALTAGKLGLMGVGQAEQYQKAREEAAKARFTPTQEGWTEAPWTKFKETLGGSVPYMAAPAAAGLAALAAPVSAPVAAAIGAGAAGLTSAAQFTGSNIARQMDTGKSLEETSLGQAVGAAIPQAALDTAAMALMPGVGKLFGSVGSKLTAAEAKAIASQTLGRTVADYTAKTGVAMGREGLTETVQQVLERLQAGLDIADPEARKEYVDSFIGGAALAGVGAPVGRAVERSAARTQVAEEEQKRLREQRRVQAEEEAKAAAQEEARKQTPEYALDIEKQYRALEQQKKDLQAQIIKAPQGEKLSEADKAANTEITGKLKELQPQLKEAAGEFHRTKDIRDKAQKQALADAEKARLAGLSPEEYAAEQAAAQQPSVTVPKAAPVEGDPFATAQPIDAVVAHAQQLKTAADQYSLTPPTVADYIQYALQDPVMADQMVKTATPMPGMNRKDAATFLGGLELHLREIKKNFQKQLAEKVQARTAALESEEAEAGAYVPPPAEPLAPGVGAEIMALHRMGAQPAGIADQFDMFGQPGQPQAPSAALGQMQQQLTGQDVTFTGEEAPRVQRGEKAPFELRGRAEGTAAPVTREELADRINRVLSTYDLSPEAVDFLRRVEQTLPQADTTIKREPRTAMVNGKPVKVEQDTGSYFEQLDQQLERIESGQEGVPRKGERRSVELQAFPTGEARAETAPPTEATAEDIKRFRSAQPGQAQSMTQVQQAALEQRRQEGKGGAAPGFVYQPKEGERVATTAGPTPVRKRVTELTADTMRGESAKPVELSMADQLQEQLRLLETVADEGVQRPLFEDADEAARQRTAAAEGKAPGPQVAYPEVKLTRAGFQTYLKSPKVEALRKALRRDQEVLKRAEQIPELEKRAKSLVDEIDGILKEFAEYRSADAIVQANKDVNQARRDIAEIRSAAGKSTVNRMMLAGRLQQLQEARRNILDEGRRLGETVEPDFLAELDKVTEALQEAQTDMALLDSALSTLDGQLRSFDALKKMSAMAEKGTAPERIPAAQKELVAVRTELEKLREDYNEVSSRLRKEAADRKRAEAAVKDAERKAIVEAGRVKPIEEMKQQLPAYDQAVQYPALSEAQRLAREKGGKLPELSEVEKTKIKGDPNQVLGGFRTDVTRLEKAIRRAQDSARQSLYDQFVGPKQKAFDAANAQYKAAKSAAERDALGPKLDAAQRALNTAEANVRTMPVTWRGMKRDIARLASALNKVEWLEGMISEGRVEIEAPQAAVRKAREEAAAKQAESERKVREAAARTEAPSTSGEALTRSEAKKAAQPQKTQFEGKGVPGGTATEIGGPTTLEKMQAAAAERLKKGKFLFSRGVPVKGLTPSALRNELDAAVGDKDVMHKKVSVFASVEEFLKTHSRYADDIPFDAKAFVDPETGRAYMFADNIAKGEGMAILLHEVGVHIGFRNFFNKSEFNALVNAVRSWANRPANTLEGKVARAALKRVEEAATPASQVDDELLAYAVEEAVKAGVEPAGTKGGSALQNWLRRIVDAFGKALEKLGIAPEKLGVGDLVNMAYGAAQLELKGTWHGTGKLFTQFDHKYMGTGEGAQAFSWGTYRAETTGVAETYREQEARKQIAAWLQEPEMVAWAKSQEPKFGGKTAKDFDTFAETGASGQELEGVPFEFAKAMAYALRKYTEDAAKLRSSNTLSPAVALGIKLKHVPRDIANRAALRDWLETADLTSVEAPSLHKLFRGRQDFEISDMPKSEISNEAVAQARDILGRLEYPEIYGVDTSKPFAEQVKTVMAELKEKAERRLGMTGELKKRGQAALAGLAELSPSDFTFNPPTPAPLPRPTGVMMRTLHGRKESEYLQWDAPWADQPESVANAFFKVIKNLTGEQIRTYDRTLEPLENANRTVKGKDVYGALSAALESEKTASEMLHKYGVAGTKFLDRPSRNKPVTEKSTYNYVDYADKDKGAAIVGTNLEPIGPAEGLLFSKAPKYANDELAQAGHIASKVIANQKPFTETIKEEGLGMGLATRLIDRFAPLEKISKLMEPLKGTQMMYYARMFDQRMHFLQQAVGNGAIGLKEHTRKDGRKEWLVESEEGASIKSVVDTLKEAKDIVGSADAASQLFSLYTVAKRAERVGLNKLNFSGAVTEAELKQAMKTIQATPGLEKIFEEARKDYNEFNKGMVKFAVDTGALSKDVAQKMLQSEDYVPFYRMRDGAVEMVLGNETIAKIGNLKNQPYLKELVGGEERILDFMVSSVQNANMLTDMALRNLATKSAVFEMQDLGMAKVGKGTSSGPDVVNFKMNGEDYHAVIDTTDAGFPAELLVKGMEGIPYQTTWLTKAMGVPAKALRQAVTLNPLYAARQLFRDSLAAPILSGADFKPVIGALKQINQPSGKTLERRGITGGQVFSGTQQDLSDTLRRLSSGESGWLQGLAKLEALSMEADALTRRAQYNSYIEQGLSEMEATYAALESMNFSKRGASPAMHFLSTVIPFFNAQIQSLNVLYKAFTGDMPFNEKLKVREKLLKRGAVLAASTIVYAALMQDDETYENATPEQKYGNWFIHVPGFDEAVKLPIPFEVGYIFKALPEALVNAMAKKEGGEEALAALKQIVLQTVPGGTSYGIPQAIKPLIEVGLGKSFYTGRDLESAHEQMLEPGKRVRDKTTDFARVVGDMFNISPIKIDALIQGYLSSTGLAMVNALSFALPSAAGPEKAALRTSELPLVGGLFQPKDAGGVINAAYDRMNEAKQVKNTFEDMVNKGQMEEARRYLQENLDRFAQSGLATNFTSQMQKLTQAERAIRASSLTPEEKRTRLDELRRAKIRLAQTVREAAGRTTPQ